MERLHVTTSRAFEYFTVPGLTKEMGTEQRNWGPALLKELIDNSLDACEKKAIASPTISIKFHCEDDGTPFAFSVGDNGPGIPKQAFLDTLNYDVTGTDKESYVSPTRGQQGNGLKTVFAAPVAMDGDRGTVEIATADYAYTVTIAINRIHQSIHRELKEGQCVSSGTVVCIHSTRLAVQCLERIDSIVTKFALFNPHAQFFVDGKEYQPAPVEKFKKWLPSQPCSAHWYDGEAFSKLAANTISTATKANRRSPSIRAFIKDNFEGLKRTDKQKLIGQAMEPATTLDDLANANGMDMSKTNRLLSLLKEATEPVKPARLGCLGQKFMESFLAAKGYPMEQFRYKKIELASDNAPTVIEVALTGRAEQKREIFWGLNFTPMLSDIPWDISYLIGKNDVLIDSYDPITLVIHIVRPKFSFKDKGKATLDWDWQTKDSLHKALAAIAKDWAKIKRKKKRSEQATLKELNESIRPKKSKVTIKSAAYQIMEIAYMAASDNNRLPANARQIMYQARPLILELTGGVIWEKDSYFTQQLLPDYIRENPVTASTWDILYDSRGHFTEPHTGKTIELGTLGVRTYVGDWQKGINDKLGFFGAEDITGAITTLGSHNRYKFALFLEKEGFLHILESADIARRHDIAIFSTKGMSNTASRQLVESLSENDVTIFVAHDFDKSGLTIARTLWDDTRRYQFSDRPNVIDIGLRLSDVEEMGLSSETVKLGNSDPCEELERCGCSQAEINFLLTSTTKPYRGERVELNAMTSPQLIDWLERKFSAHGVAKFVPDESMLMEVYRLQVLRHKLRGFVRENVEEPVKKEIDRLEALDIPKPDKLAIAVQDQLKANPMIPWDVAVDQVAAQFIESEQENLAS